MTEEIEVLKTVTERLDKASVPYMITGSIATNFYATPRMTRDIDIVIVLDKSGAGRLINQLKNDFYVGQEAVTTAIAERGIFNAIHNKSVIKVDFVVRKDSEYRHCEFERRRPIEIEGIKMWIVSPEDLILSKLFWAKESLSEFQLRDVRNLLEGVKDLDMDYIGRWVRSLELEPIYGKVKS